MNKIDPKDFKTILDLAYTAHQKYNKKDSTRQRGGVPFVVHPIWCALTILNDQKIPFEEREIGYQVLMLHDVLEDTNFDISKENISSEVLNYVKEMTFESWGEEKVEVLQKTPFVKMLKLCDKISSMYDECVGIRKRGEWKELTEKLLVDVERYYGRIRLVTIAEAILNESDW